MALFIGNQEMICWHLWPGRIDVVDATAMGGRIYVAPLDLQSI